MAIQYDSKRVESTDAPTQRLVCCSLEKHPQLFLMKITYKYFEHFIKWSFEIQIYA